MGYLHISNLYKDQTILLFRECYALEKVHGTSAHVAWAERKLRFFSGGEKHERFVKLFDQEVLAAAFVSLGHPTVTIYGEAYGGKMQGMKATYGAELRFIVFDVKVGDVWLAVPDMNQVARGLKLEVVPWCRTPTDLASLDAVRDAPSSVATLSGCGHKPREGVVLRPLIEMTTNSGARVIAKHKGEAFNERKTPQKIIDPAKLAVLTEANAVAQEWVTPMRLGNVLSHMPQDIGMEKTGDVIKAMVADVIREGAGEFVNSKDVRKAIGKRAAELFKALVQSRLKKETDE